MATPKQNRQGVTSIYRRNVLCVVFMRPGTCTEPELVLEEEEACALLYDAGGVNCNRTFLLSQGYASSFCCSSHLRLYYMLHHITSHTQQASKQANSLHKPNTLQTMSARHGQGQSRVGLGRGAWGMGLSE